MIFLKSDRSQTCATLTRFPSQAYAAIREAKQKVENRVELIDARLCHIAQIGNKNFVDYTPFVLRNSILAGDRQKGSCYDKIKKNTKVEEEFV